MGGTRWVELTLGHLNQISWVTASFSLSGTGSLTVVSWTRPIFGECACTRERGREGKENVPYGLVHETSLTEALIHTCCGFTHYIQGQHTPFSDSTIYLGNHRNRWNSIHHHEPLSVIALTQNCVCTEFPMYSSRSISHYTTHHTTPSWCR